MNKVRQGILSRPTASDQGRNRTTVEQQFHQEVQKLSTKQARLTEIGQHRRVVIEGQGIEKVTLQQRTKAAIDQTCQDRRDALQNITQQQQQLDRMQLNSYSSQGKLMDLKEQTRRDYQKQIMEENRRLAQQKVERAKNEKMNEWATETRNQTERHGKQAVDYL